VDLFEPSFALSAMFALQYFFTTVYVLFMDEADIDIIFANMNIDMSDPSIPPALMYVCSGLIAFYLGYYLVKIKKEYRVRIYCGLPPFEKSVVKLMLYAYALNVLLRVYLFSQGWASSTVGLSDSDIPMGWFSPAIFYSNLWIFFYSFVCYDYFSDPDEGGKYILPALLFELAFLLQSGDRRNIFPLIIIPMAIYWYKYIRLPVRTLAISAVALVTVFIPASTLFGYALADFAWQKEKIDSVAQVMSVIQYGIENRDVYGLSGLVSYAINPIIQSFSGIFNVGVAINMIADKGHLLNGETYQSALLSFMPAVLAPDKYVNQRAILDEFGSYFLMRPFYPSPVAVNQASELYMNFGTVGMAAGMFVQGGLIRMTYYLLVYRMRQPWGLWIYVALIHYIIISLPGGGVAGDFLLVVRMLFYLLLMMGMLGAARAIIKR
jgi:hypothetical protein